MNIVKDMRLEVFFLMIAAIIFSGCGQSGEKEASQQIMISNVQLKKMALRSCRSKLKEKLGHRVYAPEATIGDGTEKLVIKWKGNKDDFKTALCTYSMDDGLISLVIDDQLRFEKKI